MTDSEEDQDATEVVQMALKALNDATKRAIKAGHTIVCVQNDVLVRLEPDGTRTELEKLPPCKKIEIRWMHRMQ